MKNGNYEYTGWKANGFIALASVLAGIAASIYAIKIGVDSDSTVVVLGAVLLLALCLMSTKGFILMEPNEARVLTFFGKYCGSFYNTGFWWINFLMSTKKISLRARNLNAEPIKVNDKTGNPVMIGMVLVWRLKRDEIYRAVFDIDVAANAQGMVSQSARMNMLESFVSVQSDAALRQVAGYYAYDNNDTTGDEVTLRSNSDEINEVLETRLAERLAIAGIEVVEARINYLAYAPEIAAVMLRRQQASAIISAREKIVEGAVSMVDMALRSLDDRDVVKLSNEQKASMVGNLLAVLCADEPLTPTLNANV